jgi:glutathione S-transferase/GST-like protein
MLELYHWEPNACFLKPLVALHERQVPFTSRWFDASQLEQLDPAFPENIEARLGQEREGPLLVHDGELISGSFLMLQYIAESFPGAPLQGADAFEKYHVQAWGQVLVGLGADVSILGCARHLAPLLRQQDPATLQAKIQRIQPLERRQAWSAVLEDDHARLAQARERLAFSLARLERALGQSPWLAGERYTLADIDAHALTCSLPGLVPDLVNAKATPHLAAFLERMRARPAVQAALAISRSGRPHEAFVPGAEPSRWG